MKVYHFYTRTCAVASFNRGTSWTRTCSRIKSEGVFASFATSLFCLGQCFFSSLDTAKLTHAPLLQRVFRLILSFHVVEYHFMFCNIGTHSAENGPTYAIHLATIRSTIATIWKVRRLGRRLPRTAPPVLREPHGELRGARGGAMQT